MTVYIVQRPKPNRHNWTPDLSPALQYGPLKYIFDEDESVTKSPKAGMKKAAKALENFSSDDFILWTGTGDPSTLFAVIMVLTARLDDIQYLSWSRNQNDDGTWSKEKGGYNPMTLSVAPFLDGEETFHTDGTKR